MIIAKLFNFSPKHCFSCLHKFCCVSFNFYSIQIFSAFPVSSSLTHVFILKSLSLISKYLGIFSIYLCWWFETWEVSNSSAFMPHFSMKVTLFSFPDKVVVFKFQFSSRWWFCRPTRFSFSLCWDTYTFHLSLLCIEIRTISVVEISYFLP